MEKNETISQLLIRGWKYLNIGYLIFWVMFILDKGDKWFWFNWNHPIVPILGFGSVIAYVIVRYKKQ